MSGKCETVALTRRRFPLANEVPPRFIGALLSNGRNGRIAMKTKLRAVTNLKVIAVVVALAIGSVPAQAQSVTTTLPASGSAT